MKHKVVIFMLLGLMLPTSGHSQDITGMIADSHIRGNAPDKELFDTLLRRDLKSYFCKQAEGCKVEYTFLREGPTQTGIAYPKYYLWVIVEHEKELSEGAVRVAAIDKQEFEITHFLSSSEIKSSPAQVASVFPAALVEKIFQKAKSATGK